MRTLIFLLLLLAPALLGAQADKLPKLRITKHFLSTAYELGDSTAKPAAVRLHLEQYNAKAYHHWRQADKADGSATVWMLIGSGGLLTGLLAKKQGIQAAGYGIGAVGYGASLVIGLNGMRNRSKAVSVYNTEAGY